MFLDRNGWELFATEEEAYATVVALAEGKLTKPQLSRWLKENTQKHSEPAE